MQFLKSIIVIPLIFNLPTMLWAITPCEEANDYVAEARFLNSIIHQVLKKESLQQALTLCPTHPEAHNELAILLAEENNDNAALYHYQQVLKNHPDNPQAWAGIGDIHYKQSQWPLSFKAYLRICTIHPYARQRVAELLRDNHYRTTDGEVVLNDKSLGLLFDKKQLQPLYQMATQCRNHDKSIAPNINAIRTILQPIIIFQKMLFQVGKDELSLVSTMQLDQIAIVLREMRARKIIIRGHSDTQAFKGKSKMESNRFNWQLSQNRAKAVKIALVQRGIPEKRIKIYGYGHTRPLVKGNNKTVWAKNRRVEIEVSN
ncbi:OmpA family protein [Candidatus Parabeggiatoa sp. HSG14]|uniref:OmpA family protein n=1 Tax=Candidatus Parabeggiatoa sp. HSG14 TaxID=3055593 RepID=UPI0025A90C31|nr:OmpA family protein [Thiotrichales bacterium HSG14]